MTESVSSVHLDYVYYCQYSYITDVSAEENTNITTFRDQGLLSVCFPSSCVLFVCVCLSVL